MKKSGNEKARKGGGQYGGRVSMTELDGRLSEWVRIARKSGPVVVLRYERPWVCIVDHGTWHQLNVLRSYIPGEDHALVGLREAVDGALTHEDDAVRDLTQRCTSGVSASYAIRAWVLQIAYSISRAQIVGQALAYNMAWRWFVGYSQAAEPLPGVEALVGDMQMVSSDPRIVEAIYQCLLGSQHLPVDSSGEFHMNFGLLHTLRHHLAAARPLEGNPPGSPGTEPGGSTMPR